MAAVNYYWSERGMGVFMMVSGFKFEKKMNLFQSQKSNKCIRCSQGEWNPRTLKSPKCKTPYIETFEFFLDTSTGRWLRLSIGLTCLHDLLCTQPGTQQTTRHTSRRVCK